ncbi:MAG TPA: DUF1566 domain-containing protein [Saprospiraceae bacterium]|nr:DUF1566 domain-containing protein [Saprospiraceae bacterium]
MKLILSLIIGFLLTVMGSAWILLPPPTVTTNSATSITITTAILNGTGNPNGDATTAWFRYSTVSPGTPNDASGTRAPSSGGASLGSGSSPVPFSHPVTGLTAGTTYFFWTIAQNDSGTTFGSILTFTTSPLPPPPVVVTNAATLLVGTNATLNGSANPNGDASTGWFRYSTTNPGSPNDSFGTRTPASGGTSLGSGSSPVPYSEPITGLLQATTYYYCAIASNSTGTAFGSLQTFIIPTAPTAVTNAPTSVVTTTATLNGTGNPNGAAATGWFRYSTTNPGTGDDVSGTRAPASGGTSLGSGTSPVPYLQALTGLIPATTYYYWAIVSNTAGTTFGAVNSFTTFSSPPTTTTNNATSLVSTTATLNGASNPNNSTTTGWFRYSTTSPGSPNDSFGTRAPANGGTSLGSGTSPVPYSEPITGLLPVTTYFYCAISSNAAGTSFGSLQTFIIPASPAAITNAATIVLGTSATLNGSGNPNASSATAWFRYSTTNPGTGDDVSGIRTPASGGTSLGSGTSPVAYPQSISGLIPGTTYYYWAIVSNSVGTSFGSVISFTTLPSPPTTTTNSATSLLGTSATLNGSANPNNGATTGWFRYSTISPGSPNDSFGTRAPSSGGTSVGSGTSTVPFSEPITGLLQLTTYFYCAIASNPTGTTFGSLQTFIIPTAPVAATNAATLVTSTSATLNGSGNPNGAATTAWFRYSTTNPGTGDDVTGTRAPASSGTSLGSGLSPVSYPQAITGLIPATTYYYWAIVSNSAGTTFGGVLAFTTPASPPSTTTTSATLLVGTTATLNGSANPNNGTTTGWFRYSTVSPGTPNDSFGTRAPSSGGTSLGSGISPVPFSEPITGLLPATTYYYCAIASNPTGTTFGSLQTFIIPTAPAAVTNAATLVTSTLATLNGSGNPNGATTTSWFRYSTTNPGTGDDVTGTRAPASGGTLLGSGTSPVPYPQAITGLIPATTYYYWAIVSNAVGTSFGSVMSFTTPASPPTTTTNSATLLIGTSATLNGSANPNNGATTGWFRYSTVSPGTPNDSFGTRAPSSGGTSVGSGTTPVPYSEPITGLLPLTTYFYCAIASNSTGTTFGSLLTFIIPTLPATVTNAATLVSSTLATLNGSGNPNGAASTGWYRYSTINPGTGDDVSGTRAPTSGGTSLGSGTSPVAYPQAITGLIPATTYYYWAIVSNSVGTSFGSVMSFTTPASPPTTTTNSATLLIGTTATLNGSANPNNGATTGWFRYSTVSPGTPNDSFGTRAPSSGGTSVGSGTSPVPYSEPITGLLPLTTYFYCAIASNSTGTTFGSLQTFIIPTLPASVTNAATLVSSTIATLNGNGNPNGAAATAWFRYSTTNPGTGDDVSGTRAPVSGGTSLGSGTSPVAHLQAITGLIPATTYYYWAIVTNAVGTSIGSVMSFTTPPSAPATTTNSATSLTYNSATLNGSANPNNGATTAWFRYSITSPGTPNDVFGIRAPSSGGASLGSGTSPVPYLQAISGLLPATTYYYAAISQNATGLTFGALLTFTTLPLPPPPTVMTNSTSSLMITTATLNGTINPNGDATTGWFRYATTNPGTCNDSFGTREPSSGGASIGSGTSPMPFALPITGLSGGTTYYTCALAQNAAATTFGSVLSFTTQTVPPSTGNVGIGTSNPNASAQLDLTSTTKGFLPPRMTASQRDAIMSPARGLVIYCTDCGGGEIELYNNVGWRNMLGNATAGPLSIGDNYTGGKIAYILQPGDPGYITGETHGLIAAVADHNTSLLWDCSGTTITGADGTALGTGNQNTIDIMAGCPTAGIAARICGDLVLNGYSDWYLPSKDELNKLYLSRVAIGGFIASGYWSSSEVDNNNAWFQNFNNGAQGSLSKNAPSFVRAVRSF